MLCVTITCVSALGLSVCAWIFVVHVCVCCYSTYDLIRVQAFHARSHMCVCVVAAKSKAAERSHTILIYKL